MWELSDRAVDGPEPSTLNPTAILDMLDGEFREPPDFAKPLTGPKPWQSLRVGEYRVI